MILWGGGSMRLVSAWLSLIVLLAGVLVGCSDDDEGPAIPGLDKGTIIIQPSPDPIEAPWELTGPGGGLSTGAGYAVLVDQAVGEYVLQWGPVSGMTTPAGSAMALAAGDTMTFTGVYESAVGTVQIVVPAEDAAWTLTGPDGFSLSDAGCAVHESLAVGSYSVTWHPLSGWYVPEGMSQVLAAGQTISFHGDHAYFAGTPDSLVGAFATFYAGRDLDGYADILGQEFLFVTEGNGDLFNFDTELAIADRMFGGLPGTDGIVISAITVDGLDPVSVWQPTPPQDEHFGGMTESLYRNYTVDFSFYIAGQDLRYRVRGPVRFHVLARDVAGPARYEIIGMTDFTFGKARVATGDRPTEDPTWSSVKALFL